MISKNFNDCSMKKYFLFFVVILFIFGCKPQEEVQQVTIKGRISHNILGQDSKGSLSLADAKKILVIAGISGDGHGGFNYEMIDIIDSSFVAKSNIGAATALVFLDANNKYIGNLSNQGLDLLPLGKLTEGETTTIDLKDLQMVGSSILPAHDPFGNEIIITPDQIEILKELDSFFEALAKNLDADNDGAIDIADDQYLFVFSSYDTYAGKYGIDNTSFEITDSLDYYINYFMNFHGVGGLPYPQNAVLTGPLDSTYSDISILHHWGDSRLFGLTFIREFFDTIPHGSSRHPFKQGIYTLDLDGKLYTFNVACTMKKEKMVLAVPTVHLNSEGKIASFSFDYRLPDKSIIDPENIITQIQAQITGFDSLGNGKQIYTGPVMYAYKPEGWTDNIANGYFYEQRGIYVHTPLQPVDISGYQRIVIGVGYYDMLGNQFGIMWERNY